MPHLLSALCAALLFVAGTAPQSGLAQDRESTTDRAVRAYMTGQRIPGLSIAIARGARIVYRHGYGWADIENRVPVSIDSRFESASTLKGITASAVLLLAQTGKLGLSEPIQRYCKTYPAKQWTVTAMDLMRHQSGIDVENNSRSVFNRDHFATISEAVAAFANVPLAYEPGAKMVYSNEGYVLLACAIEGASGLSYQEYIRQAILEPAGMRSTEADDWYRIVPNRAHSYVLRTAENTRDWQGLWSAEQLASIPLNIPVNADPVDPTVEMGAAGYETTPSDLIAFAVALRRGLLNDAMVTTMFTRQHLRDGSPTDFGLAWMIGDFDGESAYRLFGSDWRGSSAILILPRRNCVLSISTNQEFQIPQALAKRLASIWCNST
jgi:CubicO group peptidase (beta-lactamase class C family)